MIRYREQIEDPHEHEAPPYTVLREETRTARKVHECAWCRDPIEVGGRYVITAAKDEDRGTVSAYKRHAVCPWQEREAAAEAARMHGVEAPARSTT